MITKRYITMREMSNHLNEHITTTIQLAKNLGILVNENAHRFSIYAEDKEYLINARELRKMSGMSVSFITKIPHDTIKSLISTVKK